MARLGTLFVFLASLLIVAAGPAKAQTPPLMDSVSLTLSSEGWVEAETAKVTVGIEAAFQGVDAGGVRAEMLSALETLAPGADWRFVRFDRSTGSSGLEQYSALAETRLGDEALDGLGDRAAAAGRAGFKLTLRDVAYTPTLAEMEAVQSALREEIYAMAGAELERVRAAYPDRDFRVASIEFYQGAPPIGPEPRMMVMEAVQATADAFSGAGVSVSQRLVLSARLVLEAELPE